MSDPTTDAIIRSFGKRKGQPGYDPAADLNNDGIVNVGDMQKHQADLAAQAKALTQIKTIYAACVIPSDMTPGSSRSYITSVDQPRLITLGMIEANRIWIKRETGRDVDIDFRLIVTPKTVEDLNKDNDGNVKWDEHQEGMYEDRAWEVVGSIWPDLYDSSKPTKVWATILGAGGWAGGRHDHATDKGGAFIGDWGIRYIVTGQPDPGCVFHYPGDNGAFCKSGNLEADFGHEIMHSFGLDAQDTDPIAGAHNPPKYLKCWDTLLPTQRANLLQRGARWLKV